MSHQLLSDKLSVWLAQSVKALAAQMHVRLYVKEVWVRSPEQTLLTVTEKRYIQVVEHNNVIALVVMQAVSDVLEITI